MPSTTQRIKPDDPVRRIMAVNIATVLAEDSLLTVAQELTAGDIGAVVVASLGTPMGVLSERDLITLIAGGCGLDAVQAGEVMTADLVVAKPEDSIESVGRLMLDAGVRHVPVREGNQLVGLVSIRDVLAVLLPSSTTDG